MEENMIIELDKQITISGTVEDLNRMIFEACGIRKVPLSVIYGKDRIVVDLLFHKKRKALCRENNSIYKLTRFYS